MMPLPHLWLGALLALWPAMPARPLTDEQSVREPVPASAPRASELPPVAGVPVPAPGPVLGTAGSDATAAAPAAADAPCEASPATRPPDPRCGETLDGRPPPSTPLTLPRAALAVPRLGARALFWPFVTASDFVEEHKLLDWMQALLTTDDGLIGVRPQLQYSTGFVSTAGLRFFDRRLPLPGSQLSARFVTGGPSTILGEAGLEGPAWLGLSLRAFWDRRRDRLFAGPGPLTDGELAREGHGQARYASDNAFAELRWSRDLPAWLTLALHTDFTRRDYRADDARGGPSVAALYGLGPGACAQIGLPGNCVDPNLLPRFDEGLRLVHGGVGLAFDRFAAVRDGGGIKLAADATFAQGIAGDPTQAVKLSAEAVVAIGGEDRVLLFRVRAAAVEKLLYAPVPFDELVSPAGGLGMRGFPDGRFRGLSGGVATVEYRWFVAYNLDATLFADAGTVAEARFRGLRLDHVFPDFGFGLRRSFPEARHWQAPISEGLQVAYAPQAGFRLLLSVAAF